MGRYFTQDEASFKSKARRENKEIICVYDGFDIGLVVSSSLVPSISSFWCGSGTDSQTDSCPHTSIVFRIPKQRSSFLFLHGPGDTWLPTSWLLIPMINCGARDMHKWMNTFPLQQCLGAVQKWVAKSQKEACRNRMYHGKRYQKSDRKRKRKRQGLHTDWCSGGNTDLSTGGNTD